MFLNQYNWIVLVSLGVCCCCATATLIVKPRNTSATEGDTIKLDCSTSNLTTTISWQYIPGAEGDLPKDVFLGGRLVNDYVRFEMHGNSAEGVYNLVIPSASLNDAGTYRCRDQDGAGEHVDVILSVTKNIDLRIAPERAEAQVGKRVQLNCITYYKTELVNWQRISLGMALPDDVYISGKFVNGYTTGYDSQMNMSTGTSNLIITAVKLEDSGLYRCIEKDGLGQYKDAELTVIDFAGCLMLPIDSCGASPVNVTLECNMTFSGKFAPRIQWVTANGDVVKEGVVTTIQSDRVTSTLVIEMENLNHPLNYTCQAAISRTYCKPTNSAHCQTEAYGSSTYSYVPDIDPTLEKPPPLLPILLPIVLVVLAIAVIAPIVIVCIFKRKKIADETQQKDQTNPAKVTVEEQDTKKETDPLVADRNSEKKSEDDEEQDTKKETDPLVADRNSEKKSEDDGQQATTKKDVDTPSVL